MKRKYLHTALFPSKEGGILRNCQISERPSREKSLTETLARFIQFNVENHFSSWAWVCVHKPTHAHASACTRTLRHTRVPRQRVCATCCGGRGAVACWRLESITKSLPLLSTAPRLLLWFKLWLHFVNLKRKLSPAGDSELFIRLRPVGHSWSLSTFHLLTESLIQLPGGARL